MVKPWIKKEGKNVELLIIDQICRCEETILRGPPCFEFHDSFSPPLRLRTSDRGTLIAFVPVWPKLGMYGRRARQRIQRTSLLLFVFFSPCFSPFPFFGILFLVGSSSFSLYVARMFTRRYHRRRRRFCFCSGLFILDHTRTHVYDAHAFNEYTPRSYLDRYMRHDARRIVGTRVYVNASRVAAQREREDKRAGKCV